MKAEDIQDWVPDAVKNFSVWLNTGANKSIGNRLLTDARMKSVWRRLIDYKKPINPDTRYADVIESFDRENKLIASERACITLYFDFWLAGYPGGRGLYPQRESLINRLQDYRLAAEICMNEAMRALPVDLKRSLFAASRHILSLSNEVEEDPYYFPKSSGVRGDDVLRGHVRHFGDLMQSLYGDVMYGTLSALINVTFAPEPPTDAEKVRGWCRDRFPTQH